MQKKRVRSINNRTDQFQKVPAYRTKLIFTIFFFLRSIKLNRFILKKKKTSNVNNRTMPFFDTATDTLTLPLEEESRNHTLQSLV